MSDCPYQLGLMTVPLDVVRPNPVALRTVNRKSEKYLGLVDSLRNKTFVGAISVNRREDVVDGEKTGKWFLELIDGLHRYSAAKDLGLATINVDIHEFSEVETLELQLMANYHVIDTKPAEMSAQLKRMLDRNPMLTEAELSSKLGVSPEYLRTRLTINKITDPNIRALIDEGKIKLFAAFALAKLPPDEQLLWVDKAMTLDANQLAAEIATRAKAIREANRRGQDAEAPVWQPTPHARKNSEIKKEIGFPETSNETGQVRKRLVTKGMQPQDAFNLALLWVVHLDPDSVAEQKAKEDQRTQARAETRKLASVDKAKAKVLNANRKTQEASLEVDLAEGLVNGTITEEQAAARRADFKAKLDAAAVS